MSTNSFRIEKFDRSINFGLWQVKMRAVLVTQKVHKALLGIERMPAHLTADQKTEMDETAVSLIQLMLSDEVLREVANEKSAAALWLKLESLYMTKTLANRVLLKQQLYTLRMVEGTPLDKHVDYFSTLIMDLEKTDVKIEEEDLAIILLCSLPPAYHQLKETLMYSKEVLNVEDVKSALFSKEILDKKLTQSVETYSSPSALILSNSTRDHSSSQISKNQKKSKPRDWNKQCSYCKKKGHSKEECYKLQNKEKKKEEERAPLPESNFADIFDPSTILMISDDRSSNDWILDTGCTFHICPHRSWFSTYRSVVGGAFLANDTLCRVSGIGTVKIKMFDGVTRTFKDVRHIPGVTKNLLSLGALEADGCRFSAAGGALKVTCGAHTILKATRQRNLYILQTEAIVAISSRPKSLSHNHTTGKDTRGCVQSKHMCGAAVRASRDVSKISIRSEPMVSRGPRKMRPFVDVRPRKIWVPVKKLTGNFPEHSSITVMSSRIESTGNQILAGTRGSAPEQVELLTGFYIAQPSQLPAEVQEDNPYGVRERGQSDPLLDADPAPTEDLISVRAADEVSDALAISTVQEEMAEPHTT